MLGKTTNEYHEDRPTMNYNDSTVVAQDNLENVIIVGKTRLHKLRCDV